MNQWLATVGVGAALCLGAGNLLAQNNNNNNNNGPQGRQGRGNFDPAQFQQRIMDNLKDQLEVTDDAEWKAMQPLIQKVFDLRRQSMSGMGRGMFGRGGPRGGDNQPSDQNRPRGGFGGAPNPDADALQKAIESKGSKAELKAALDKYVASRKANQAALDQAQADLRKVLTSRQEAIATLNGLL